MAEDEKEARLAAALRANLKRRKAQARERDAPDPGLGLDPAPSTPPEAARTSR